MKADGKLIEWQAGIRANRPLTDTVAGRLTGNLQTGRQESWQVGMRACKERPGRHREIGG